MRINNPKSMVGITRDGSTADMAYNLATIGQVKIAVDELDKRVHAILAGAGNAGNGGIPTASNTGYGYAWLNSDGVIASQLLPKLAITETFTVKQSELITINGDKGEGGLLKNDELARAALNVWLKRTIDNNVEGATYQKGDIIVVTVDSGEVVKPDYAGSYIIVDVPNSGPTNTTNEFIISKLAYSDGNVVNINDKVADNLGNVVLNLYDILKSLYIERNDANPTDSATKLTNTVYRLVTLDEEDGYRFAFIDNAPGSDGLAVPYTKLAEFTTEKAFTAERVLGLSNAIDALSERHDAELEALSTSLSGEIDTLSDRHDTELNALAEKHDADIANLLKKHNDDTALLSTELSNVDDFISGTIGSRSDAESRDLNATVFAQTKKLRTDVDYNLAWFKRTGDNTNIALNGLLTNIKNLHQGLNKRAVRMYLQQFTWGEGTLTKFNPADGNNLYRVSCTDVQGVLTYKHTHSPVANGTFNSFGTNVTAQQIEGADAQIYKQGLLNSSDSEERIIAVYDENFNLVTPDIVLKQDITTGLKNTEITVQIDYVGTENDKVIGSLEGKVWTMLIAKTIDGITLDSDYVNPHSNTRVE